MAHEHSTPISVTVDRHTVFPEGCEAQREWNSLAGNQPFRSHEWLHSWWQHYGQDRELYLLRVSDAERGVIGIAPWYLDRTTHRVVRFLGDGKVCSDYLSLLCRPEDAVGVARAIAKFLVEADAADHPDGWDALNWEAISPSDEPLRVLCETLAAHEFPLQETTSTPCYALALPATFAEYVAARSKTSRNLLHSLERRTHAGDLKIERIRTPSELDDEHWNLFVDLHQLRRRMLGEQGCFSFPPFGDFLRQATERLMRREACELMFAYDGETPMSVIHLLLSHDTTFMYQSGMDAGVTEKRPGTVANAIVIKDAIQRGATCLDFLRGNEAYKQRWGAEEVPTIDVRVSSRRTLARVRHGVVTFGNSIKEWVKSSFDVAGQR